MKGFTIIELMISLFIGMVVFGGVFSTFKNQNAIYNRQEMRIRMNQDVRIALDFMQRYLKTAGMSVSECVQDGNGANTCSGIDTNSNTTTKIIFTSDKNLNGTIETATVIANSKGIASPTDMDKFFHSEKLAFITNPNPNDATIRDLFLCYDTNTYVNSNQCQFLIGGITEFTVNYSRRNNAGTIVSATPISTASQIDITLKVRSARIDSIGTTSNTNAGGYLESSQIKTTIYLINKANSNLMQ